MPFLPWVRPRARGQQPVAAPTAKRKRRTIPKSRALLDIVSTSLLALQQSADVFPPLKSAVSGVLAVWDIAERAKCCKSDARDIAQRAEDILHLIAEAVPDPSSIPGPMLRSIEDFTLLLHDIDPAMKKVLRSRGVSRLMHLNSTEHTLQNIKHRLDDAYRDFRAASALRAEVQQADIAVQQKELALRQACFAARQARTELAIGQANNELQNKVKPTLSIVVFYSRLSVFLAYP